MDSIVIDPSAKIRQPFKYEGEVVIGKNTIIDRGVIIRGKITIGDNVTIEPYIKITGEGYVGNGSLIAHSIHNPQIGKNCTVLGLVTNSTIHDNVYIGEFAEVNRSTLCSGVNAKHTCGIRDAYVGASTNFSGGAQIWNYDGGQKGKTNIGSNVFIGGNVRILGYKNIIIGDESYIAEGSLVDRNVPGGALFVHKTPGLREPTIKDNASWYLFGNYLFLDKAVGPKYRSEFINEIVKKHGGNIEEIKKWLKTPMQKMGGKTPIECVREEGCKAMDDIFAGAIKIKEETRKAETVAKLKEAVKNFTDDPERWINTEIPTGPLFRKTPKEAVEMLGEKIIPLMVSFAKTKTIH